MVVDVEIWPWVTPSGYGLTLDGDDPRRYLVVQAGKTLMGQAVPTQAVDVAAEIAVQIESYIEEVGDLYADPEFQTWAERARDTAEQVEALRLAEYERQLEDDGWAKGSEIKPRKIDFLVRPYIPLGYPTLLAGDPGVGKSKMSLAIAAGVTTGLYGEPRNVLIMSVEDDHEASIAPMLIKLGADMERVHILPIDKAFVLDTDGFAKLDRALEKFDPLLVVIDPMTFFLGGKVDMHRANEVRAVMKELGARAAKRRNVILPIIHVNKGQSKMLYKILGSIDFSASVRSVLAVGMLDDEPERGRVVIHVKTNAAKLGDPFGFDLKEDSGDPDGAPVFAWRKTDITRAEIEGSKPGRKPVQSQLCRNIVIALLKNGPLDSRLVTDAVTAAGVSEATLRRVRQEIVEIESSPAGPGGGRKSVWRLGPLIKSKPDPDVTEWLAGLAAGGVSDGQ